MVVDVDASDRPSTKLDIKETGQRIARVTCRAREHGGKVCRYGRVDGRSVVSFDALQLPGLNLYEVDALVLAWTVDSPTKLAVPPEMKVRPGTCTHAPWTWVLSVLEEDGLCSLGMGHNLLVQSQGATTPATTSRTVQPVIVQERRTTERLRSRVRTESDRRRRGQMVVAIVRLTDDLGSRCQAR